MSQHIIIDGNNLLYAMHAHAPIPAVGRETMVKVIDRWVRQGEDQVTLVFDGPQPRSGLSKQMSSSRITVKFSSPKTADDIIVEMIKRERYPTALRIVTGDTAIRHEAKLRRCEHTTAVDFVSEIFDSGKKKSSPATARHEKPQTLSPEEKQEWLDIFDDGDEPPDPEDFESMMQ